MHCFLFLGSTDWTDGTIFVFGYADCAFLFSGETDCTLFLHRRLLLGNLPILLVLILSVCFYGFLWCFYFGWLLIDSGAQFFWSGYLNPIVELLPVFGLLVMFLEGLLAEWFQGSHLLRCALTKRKGYGQGVLFDGYGLLFGRCYYGLLLDSLFLPDWGCGLVVIHLDLLCNFVVWLDLDLLLLRYKFTGWFGVCLLACFDVESFQSFVDFLVESSCLLALGLLLPFLLALLLGVFRPLALRTYLGLLFPYWFFSYLSG
jgi:hypothetical protein